MQLSNFKTYVKLVFKRNDKDTEIAQFYNDSVIAVAIKMPHGAYKYQSYIPLVPGQEDYCLPSNIIHLMHPVKNLDGADSNDSGYPLNHITKQEYDILYPNPNRDDPSITGDAKDYCIYSGSILVGPIPQAGTDDLLEIDWTKRATTQSADDDTLSLGSEWDEVFKQMTLSRLYDSIGLVEEGAIWRAKYEDATGNPIGHYRDLLNIEKDKEGMATGQVLNNQL